MARILGIAGSPHKNGNTSYAVRYALDAVKENNETRYISLSSMKINPCVGCFKCSETGKCVFNDDMNDIYSALKWCDAVVIGSPVYMGLVSGQIKTMMDRCVLFRSGYDKPLELEGKVGCGIACGNFRNGGQETTLQNIHTFLLQQNIKVVNDGFPYSHAGAAIVGKAEDDKTGLETVYNSMRNILKALNQVF